MSDAVPLAQFRAAHGLPSDFGVALFEPKDRAGLGSLDGAGAALTGVRARVTAQAAALALHDPRAWALDGADRAAALFRAALEDANAAIGLRPSEIDYAVAGFHAVVSAYVFAWLRAGERPDFTAVYADWLAGTWRASALAHPYDHAGERWTIHILNNAYGRVGLRVKRPSETTFVRDEALACPASGFMAALLAEVCARVGE
jgi:hypothetical protein